MNNKNQTPHDSFDTSNHITIQDDVAAVEAAIAGAAATIRDLGRVVIQMEERLRIAKGTGDVTAQAQQAVTQTQMPEPARRGRRPSTPPAPRIPTQNMVTVPVEPGVPLIERVISALTMESMTESKLARVTGASTGAVNDVVKNLRSQGRIYNVGSAEYPRWTYRIGDNTDTTTLTNVIRRLISERPMTTRELVDATGARLQRVSGVIVQLKRGPDEILNMSHSRWGRYFLVSPDAKPTRLEDPRRLQ